MPASGKHKGLRVGGVAAKLGIGISSVWFRAKTEPGFPLPLKIGANTTIWIESELDEYIERQIARTRGSARVAITRKTGGQA
ncbi:helix-turn-helix transcriptional regulator [Paraburkholderia graminis]|uniref:DNA-binding transcriptional regulator AlpA n=1 Tax=Paraburkholderia graminis TaxID=60548 RepID=A0ABD5CEE9_9BURK|nr:AlpA family phage regulatory protein [Paraburkholderia graminis]MDR6203266.1 putative DNA-binding transcriptional regulator AlpA [Paraburkholderia graminis]